MILTSAVLLILECRGPPRYRDNPSVREKTNNCLSLFVFCMSLLIVGLAATVLQLSSSPSNESFAVVLLIVSLISLIVSGAILATAVVNVCQGTGTGSTSLAAVETAPVAAPAV